MATHTRFASDRSPASAQHFSAALQDITGLDRLRVELWNGEAAGPPRDAAVTTLSIHSRDGLNRLLGAAPERAFGRAYAEGLLDIEPLEPFLRSFATATRWAILSAVPHLVLGALQLGARPDRRPSDGAEARLTGRRHSQRRDAAAIRHHYDLPEEFYALWLDRTLTYSCAYFKTPDDDIDTAQLAKLDLVCRKLRLKQGERLLDVGCGWGSLPIFAAREYGVHVTGITLSPTQAETARRRVADEGLGDRVSIRLADYRDPIGGGFDAVATVGMVEHVGRSRMDDFAAALYRNLRPGGRLLLHGITIPAGTPWRRGSFLDAFVFPDGELEDVSWRDSRMVRTGFELRDVESLREHYRLTLSRWVQRLREHWDEAVAIAGLERARVWLLYLTGSMVAFEVGTIGLHQSLLIRPHPDGSSELPLRRSDWYAD